MQVILWLGKSLLILGIFHLVVPTVVNSWTRNSWTKLTVMLLFAFVAAVFMAWLEYVPYIIFFIWLSLTYYTLQVMTEAKFEHDADMRMNKPVFYISSYPYVVTACVLACLFQVEIVTGDPAGPGMTLWRYMIGLK